MEWLAYASIYLDTPEREETERDVFVEQLKMFREFLLVDTELAIDVYRALCNTTWERAGWPEKIVSMSWRESGGLVAEVRNIEEDYIHFYISGNEGDVTEEVRELFLCLGYIESKR